MGSRSKIEWTDSTWNPVTGCTKVSPGCARCYAERLTERFNGKGSFETVVLHPERLEEPLRWRKPRMVFTCSMSDLFQEAVPDEFLDRVFAVMALTPQHTYQVLTKRPERMIGYLIRAEAEGRIHNAIERAVNNGSLPLSRQQCLDINRRASKWAPQVRWPLPNVWCGTSVENQAMADLRIPLLLQTPAAVRFVSYEPALESVDFTRINIREHPRESLYNFIKWESKKAEKKNGSSDAYAETLKETTGGEEPWRNALTGDWFDGWDSGKDGKNLDWVICGGESGPGARPMHPDWARAVRDQCQAAGVPFFFKQWGEWEPQLQASGKTGFGSRIYRWPDEEGDCRVSFRIGKKAAGRLLDGREWNQMPKEGGR